MTESREVSREDFFSTIDVITYRNQDIQEAIEFGCTDILDCYMKAKHRFAKYYIVEEDGRPIVTVMLQRDGHIIFFISNVVNNNISLIRELRILADTTVANAGAIITKTALWYTEAQRLNRLIGFRDYQIYDYFGYYVKD
jgi:hypothetical protein